VDFHYHPLLGVLAAALLGGAVGVQRQAAQKPAGFRTHLLVAMACAGFTAISAYYNDTRIAANVLTGIGFIGAGVIVRTGFSAQGITTAASIWTVAAIGVCAGFGQAYGAYIAITLTVVSIAALSFSDTALMHFMGFPQRATIGVQLSLDKDASDAVHGVFDRNRARYEPIGTLTADIQPGGGAMFRQFLVTFKDEMQLRELCRELRDVDGVTHVRLNEPFLAG
jgi:uncharacterized membrane protein YhiD involved in acid resistance